MLKSIEGIYRDGKIELAETPVNVPNQTPVVVTFLELGHIDLVGVHFSVKNAGEFARFVREQRGSPYLVIVGARARTGCVDHFKDGIEKGQIPYDMISYKQDWRESITTVIERLVRCLNETEEERCLKK